MKDRIPTYPNRVRLVPVPGRDGYYDVERADEPTQEGTKLNKATLLTDETAAAVKAARPGFSGEVDTVNDALAALALGGVSAGASEPGDKSGLWVDTSNGAGKGVLKYYDTALGKWTPVWSVWGVK